MKFFYSFFLFIILFSSTSSFPCDFKESPVISLSGPVTHYLYYLGLLEKSEKLKVISLFHGISSEEFSGEMWGGGLFLSEQHLKKAQNAIIFYDKGENLDSLFEKVKQNKQNSLKEVVAVSSIGKDPFQVYEETEELLTPYLMNCEKEQQDLRRKIETIKEDLLKAKKSEKRLFFYLGKIKEKSRKPPKLMVQDGPPKFLAENHLFKSYPSPLPYVPWSTKIVQELKGKGDILHIGLIGQKQKSEHSIKDFVFESFIENGEKVYNLFGAGVLIPGISQIFWMQKILEVGMKS